MPKNRLRKHLETCALVYGCPAAKNFFIGRYEAPLPTSRHCNARCLGCISKQENSGIRCSQERIIFTPKPEEIAQVALEHINKVEKAIVSFGQGCEGEPLLAFNAIEPGIKLIRSKTSKGTINLNTNASMPELIKKLFSSGLDSIRVSMNSVQKKYYNAYFRPVSYCFEDVLKSIEIAKEMDKFVSINYLNCPGFTDTLEEEAALIKFISKFNIDLIQWRNLNYDPLKYYKAMFASEIYPTKGVKNLLFNIKKSFPKLRYGYFNPYLKKNS